MPKIKIFDLPYIRKEVYDENINNIKDKVHNMKSNNIVISDIDNVNYQSIFKYCIPVSDGNPNIIKKQYKKNGIWIEFTKSTRVIDLSNEKYNIPQNSKVYIIGVYTKFYSQYVFCDKTPSIILIKDINVKTIIDDINMCIDYNNRTLSKNKPPIIENNDNKVNRIQFGDKTLLKYLSNDVKKIFNNQVSYNQISMFGWANIIDRIILNNTPKYQLIDYNNDIFISRYQQQLYEYNLIKYDKITRRLKLGDKFSNISKEKQAIVKKQIFEEFPEETKIINKLRYAIKKKYDKQLIQELLNELIKIFDIDTSTDKLFSIKGKKHSDILCPHLIDHAKSLLSGYNDKIISVIASKWGMDAPVDYSVFCKLCGSLIMIDDLEELNIYSSSARNYGIKERTYVWNRLYNEIIQSIKLLNFKNPVNIQKFANQLANALIMDIDIQNNKIRQIKTYTEEDQLNMLQLYIILHIYAYINYYIINKPGKFNWNIKLKNGSSKIKLSIAHLLKISYALLLNTKQTLIDNIKHIITDIKIQTELMNIYDNISGMPISDTLKIDEHTQKLLTISYIDNDPMWDIYKLQAILKKSKLIDKYDWKKFINVADLEKDYLKKSYRSNLQSNIPWIQELLDSSTIITTRLPEPSSEFESYLKKYSGEKIKDDAIVLRYYKQFYYPSIRFNKKPIPKLQPLISKLSKSDEKQKFYRIYKYKCPKGGAHEWKMNGILPIYSSGCKKCKFTKPDDSYFKKWYKKPKDPKLNIIRPLDIKNIQTYPWSNTLNNILKLSKITTPNMTYHSWRNLGLFESQIYNNVKLGRIETTYTCNRLNKLISFNIFIIRSYEYVIQKRHNNMHYNAILLPFWEELTIEDRSKLKPMNDTFWDEINKPTIELRVNYVLHHICTNLLYIHNCGKKFKLSIEGIKTMNSIFNFLISNIYKSTQIISTVEKEKIISNNIPITDDDNIKNNSNDDDDDVENNDPFSLSNLDIEHANAGDEYEENSTA